MRAATRGRIDQRSLSARCDVSVSGTGRHVRMTPIIRTQRDVILDALKSAGDKGLCISDLADVDWTVVLTARNRISEMRASGLRIESSRCTRHAHRSTVSRYTLKEKAASPISGRAASITRRAVASDSTPRRLVTAPVQQVAF